MPQLFASLALEGSADGSDLAETLAAQVRTVSGLMLCCRMRPVKTAGHGVTRQHIICLQSMPDEKISLRTLTCCRCSSMCWASSQRISGQYGSCWGLSMRCAASTSTPSVAPPASRARGAAQQTGNRSALLPLLGTEHLTAQVCALDTSHLMLQLPVGLLLCLLGAGPEE